jgi:GNAT superfamily N-acetyltransferase
MATAEGWRGRGVGARVLAAVVDHVSSRGGGLLWCNARLPAVAFYERGGFEVGGDPWDEPHIGPHVAMRRRI